MTPGKLTTELVYTLKVSLVSDERAIPDETARTTTAGVIELWLKQHLDGLHPNDSWEVEVVPRSRMLYDLRGLDGVSPGSFVPHEGKDA